MLNRLKMLYLPGKMMSHQWIAGFGVTMLNMQGGLLYSWLSPALARLTAPNSPLPLTLDQASWVASLTNVGEWIGAITAAILINVIGCKRSIFVSLWPVALGWFFVIVADSVEWLYASRVALGTGSGMIYFLFPIYVGEVSIPKIRGALIVVSNVGGNFGGVVASVLGPYLSLSTAASIYFGLVLPLMVLFFWLPDSPYHLIKVGDRIKAEKSLKWYRNDQEVDKELKAVEVFVGDSFKQSFKRRCREFKTPSVRKATFQMMALFTFMNISGVYTVVIYMESILKNAKFTMFNPSSLVIYVGISSMFASAVSSLLIDRFGRKFLMLVSSSGVCLSMSMLSLHFLLIGSNEDAAGLQWLVMASLFLLIVFFCLGLLGVPDTIMSETFPAHIKGMAALIGTLTSALAMFVMSKTYQPLVDTLGESSVFITYAVCTSVAIPYTIFFMRETKGKTLTEIQDDFRKK